MSTNKGKDVKQVETPSKDSEVEFGQGSFRFRDRMSLAPNIKTYINALGKDFRFLNAREFRNSGNLHHSYWVPFVVPQEERANMGANAEGNITRGDMILGVRDKRITKAHRKFLDERVAIQNGTAKSAAAQLRDQARKSGGSVGVIEGFDDNE